MNNVLAQLWNIWACFTHFTNMCLRHNKVIKLFLQLQDSQYKLTKSLLIPLFLAWSHFGLNFTARICSVGPRSSPLCLTLLGTVWRTWEQWPCSQSKTNYTNEEHSCPNEVSRVNLEDVTVHHMGREQWHVVPIQQHFKYLKPIIQHILYVKMSILSRMAAWQKPSQSISHILFDFITQQCFLDI